MSVGDCCDLLTLAVSLVAQLGPSPITAFQTCFQVWLSSSVLADGLSAAGQAILAGAFAQKDYKKSTATATRVLVLQMIFILAVGLALVVELVCTLEVESFLEMHLIKIGLPFAAATTDQFPVFCV